MQRIRKFLLVACVLLVSVRTASNFDHVEDEADFYYENLDYEYLDKLFREDMDTNHENMIANDQPHYYALEEPIPPSSNRQSLVSANEHNLILAAISKDTLGERQALLEACLRNNLHFHSEPCPCYTSWLLLASCRVLSLSAKTILESVSKHSVSNANYLNGWRPTFEELLAFARIDDPIFMNAFVTCVAEGEEGIRKITIAWAKCLRNEAMSLEDVTIYLAMWIYSITNAWPVLKRPQFNNETIPSIIFEPHKFTLSITSIESIFVKGMPYTCVVKKSQPVDQVNRSTKKRSPGLLENHRTKRRKVFQSDFDETQTRTPSEHSRQGYMLLRHVMSLDPTQTDLTDLSYGLLVRRMEKHIKERLIPLALEKLQSSCFALEPINERYLITKQSLRRLQNIATDKSKKCGQWVIDALGAMSDVQGGGVTESEYMGTILQDFSMWYASLIVLTVGPSSRMKYDSERDVLTIRT